MKNGYWELGHRVGRQEALDEVYELVFNWHDVSVKSPNSNLALMITNGGYIHKWTLLDKLEELLNALPTKPSDSKTFARSKTKANGEVSQRGQSLKKDKKGRGISFIGKSPGKRKR